MAWVWSFQLKLSLNLFCLGTESHVAQAGFKLANLLPPSQGARILGPHHHVWLVMVRVNRHCAGRSGL